MPRPKKYRQVCCMPFVNKFVPVSEKGSGICVVMSVDEYETIRLIDYEGYSQEECSEYMNVARTTAQQIYNSARKKLSKVIVEGLPLKIEGGDYRLCDKYDIFCTCRKYGCMTIFRENLNSK